jgi:hypothetical protein
VASLTIFDLAPFLLSLPPSHSLVFVNIELSLFSVKRLTKYYRQLRPSNEHRITYTNHPIRTKTAPMFRIYQEAYNPPLHHKSRTKACFACGRIGRGSYRIKPFSRCNRAAISRESICMHVDIGRKHSFSEKILPQHTCSARAKSKPITCVYTSLVQNSEVQVFL